ncbi:enhancer of mRNA-decapping protein 4-like [Corythoichthys intestinalis]|uniref:enhancer of mRNA-decapping protein 4-like n=1 Tax=Corythoichthys intestinalis TaxID=161448 RepID=UPI0025A4EF59|nr:enhancer of mRNA-decapping protein 4-like [Corythoichthys intestinalis]XP_057689501.1 enhancer of mRNA-decapping protein 4-like [Corythoichthys intestinalis]XP_057689502.1 enhancer of mRNA-decapping protein 4-like [Corythoichthys intestinalis]XP_057689503.1 enhancer of mRNA-decapping protein 4-like [Corythoichthys intestinalis]XP_057689504.1 enhancer of mRNA-decapping protein 4-like [Corythoichthys intestinalis]XP_057689505.1 enhancer of mRNA-decapping protein 4-like [Corythoichthys intesti
MGTEKPGPIEAACTEGFQSIVLLAAKEIDKKFDDMFNRGKEDESEPFFGPMCQLESDIRPMIEAEVRRLIHFTKKNRLASSVSAILLHTDGFLQPFRQYIKSVVEVEQKKLEAHQAYVGKKEEILQLIQWREYKQAMEMALSSNDQRLVTAVCRKLNKLGIYLLEPCPFEPFYMLSIIERMPQNLEEDEDTKDRFLLKTVRKLTGMYLFEKEKMQMVERLKESITAISDIVANKPEGFDSDLLTLSINCLSVFIG